MQLSILSVVPNMSVNTILLIVPTGVPLPPIVLYVLGAILVMYGILRAKCFGAPRTPRESDEKADVPKETSLVRGPTEHRHLRLGILSVLLGLFIMLSTYFENH